MEKEKELLNILIFKVSFLPSYNFTINAIFHNLLHQLFLKQAWPENCQS